MWPYLFVRTLTSPYIDGWKLYFAQLLTLSKFGQDDNDQQQQTIGTASKSDSARSSSKLRARTDQRSQRKQSDAPRLTKSERQNPGSAENDLLTNVINVHLVRNPIQWFSVFSDNTWSMCRQTIFYYLNNANFFQTNTKYFVCLYMSSFT